MIIGQKGVKYGLTIRKPETKGAKPQARKTPVFGNEDSDDDHDNVEQQIARHQARKQDDGKVAAMHEAALAEDASVFDYDAHYDAIQEAREAPKRLEKQLRQSRYIGGLLEKAEERKREQDVLYERRLLKEREAEDHLYGEKERFVTSAYKKKMEEMQRLQEDQKQRQAEEEANAVEKKGHMGDFYRNLLQNNVAFGTARPQVEQKGGSASLPGPPVSDGQSAKEAPSVEGRSSREPESERARSSAPPASASGRARESPQRSDERAECLEVQAAKREAEQFSNQLPVRPTAGVAEESDEEQPGPPPKPSREDAVAAARQRYLERKRKAAGS